jgi:MATE family multidrug resistance protein
MTELEEREIAASRVDRARRGVALVRAFRLRHGRQILRLASPTVLTMLSHTLMWTVDTALLGHRSSLALGAAGLGGMITWTLYSLFNNLNRITTTFVAQAHGRLDHPKVALYTWQGVYTALATGAFLQLLGWASRWALPLTGNPPEVLALTYVYIKWRTLSAVFTQLSFALMGFFQGRQDVRTPMWAGIAGNAVNIVLDVWLIFGWSGLELGGWRLLAVPALGVKGAAIATSAGTLVNAALLVGAAVSTCELRRRYGLHRPRPVRWDRLRDLARVGAPAAWEGFVDMTSFMFFSIFVGTAGAVALAASQITIQLLAFSFMPLWGIAIAGSVLTGNAIGAGKTQLAAAYGREVYMVGLFYMGLLGALMLVLRHELFHVFSTDPAVLAVGATLTVIAALFQFGDGLRLISVGLLSGAGDTRFPMLLSLVLLWGIFIPLTYVIVVVRGGGVTGAWTGGALIYLLQGSLLVLRFRSGRWGRIRIFSADD